MRTSKHTRTEVIAFIASLSLLAFGFMGWPNYTGQAQNVGQKKSSPDAEQKKELPGEDEEEGQDDEEDDQRMPVIYMHYDYMVKRGPGRHSHEPQPQSIRMVVKAFKNHGIKLHIDPQHTAIPESPFLGFGEHNCAESVNFFDLKAQYFHPRGNHPWHYAIFGHAADANFVCGLAVSGVAEIGGYNFMVTLGQFLDGVPPDLLPWIEGGAFMHELGHNFGLLHGGFENHNRKPNYISIMNASYIFNSIQSAASPGSTVAVHRRLDYSDRALPTLDENHLDENVGVSAGNNDIVNYVCSSDPLNPSEGRGPGTGPIDWNCNGLIESDVQADINLFFDNYPYDRFILLRGTTTGLTFTRT